MADLESLRKYIKELNKVCISFSGGIDSTFLLKVASLVLDKENLLAIIANGDMLQKSDLNDAISFLKDNDINYKIIDFKPLEIEQFRLNKKNRCYYCKYNLMSNIKKEALKEGFEYVLDGKNKDDLNVYRPGNKASEELNILSPLALFDFTKKDIRNYSKDLEIPIWNKPSNSCLATRFPYDTYLSKEKLIMVESAENLIRNLGIDNVRVRYIENTAQIEVDKIFFNKIINNDKIINNIKNLGFKNVLLNLDGIKSGTFDK